MLKNQKISCPTLFDALQDWNAKSILDRGLKMLAFLEDRWNISLGTPKEMKEILLLDVVK